jgi:hypothetical protein
MPAPWRFLPAGKLFGGKNCRHAIDAGGIRWIDPSRRTKKDPDQSGPGPDVQASKR